jgi:hypothetical protein
VTPSVRPLSFRFASGVPHRPIPECMIYGAKSGRKAQGIRVASEGPELDGVCSGVQSGGRA